MDVIGQITQSFALSLAWGMGLFSFIVRPELTGGGFHRLCYMISLGALLVGCAIEAYYRGMDRPIVWTALFIMAAFNTASILLQRDNLSWASSLARLIHAGTGAFSLATILDQGAFPYFLLASSALYLGSVTFAMILGHWYLVVPKLTEQPLKVSHYWMWAFLGLKVCLGIFAYLSGPEFFEANTQTTVGGGYIFNWIMGSMRWLWGLVMIGLLSFFSWKLVVIRSIQSATGVLYVMTFFILMGEIISQYFFFKYGVML